MKNYITSFFNHIQEQNISIYNEISFQLELGIFLRDQFPGYKVEFERNVKTFFPNETNTVKHEIDIVVWKEVNGTKECKCAIELKFPKNGQYPEEMYQFVQDIKFMEQVKALGFQKAYTITLANDCNYYDTNNPRTKKDGIYSFFRNKASIHGTIYRPTGEEKNIKNYCIDGEYKVDWTWIKNRDGSHFTIEDRPVKYYILEI